MSLKPAQISVDEARILPRFRLVEHQASIFRSEFTRARTAGTPTTRPTHHLVGEPADLRGIPCIAKGVGGTQPHTQPEQETIYRLTPRRPA